MIGFFLRSGTYYIIWQKFKKQIIILLISAGLIFLTLNIYNDLFSVLKISNKESIFELLLIKWFLIIIIVSANVFMLMKTNIKESIKQEERKWAKKEKPLLSAQEILINKKKLLNTTDLILAKHRKKKAEDEAK